ncbi:uncharacterized protein LOC126840205 isoform X2 [Adelges cooleyi]|uniref:uncharacterized protein LOC126840205 isoform X2 n=1 Tax=Adelges cooleyi TaxID=133065 RepID=UPI0021800E11|nr:uncharacterized protein LOC126840205 isoform X2 [Adelges cooleyi]
MKTLWAIVLIISFLGAIRSNLQDEYSQYSFYQKRPLSPRPMDSMADLTNDLGVCVLRVIAAGGVAGNIAFSPFGLMAVSVLLYEGSSGYSALQIKQSLNLPWEILAVRIGMRDLNRYLKTYFKSDGFLNGLTMSREEVCLRPQFKSVLQLYGFDEPNSFLIDSCPEVSSTTQSVAITTEGTVVAEMTPTSQTIQVTNVTKGSASDVDTVITELPVTAKVTYVGDGSFTMSKIDMSTNPAMNSHTDKMVVEIGTQPQIKPLDSTTTSQPETTKYLAVEEALRSSNEIDNSDYGPYNFGPTDNDDFFGSLSSNEPMLAEATVTQMSLDISSNALTSETKPMPLANNTEPNAKLVETSTGPSVTDTDFPATSSMPAIEIETILTNASEKSTKDPSVTTPTTSTITTTTPSTITSIPTITTTIPISTVITETTSINTVTTETTPINTVTTETTPINTVITESVTEAVVSNKIVEIDNRITSFVEATTPIIIEEINLVQVQNETSKNLTQEFGVGSTEEIITSTKTTFDSDGTTVMESSVSPLQSLSGSNGSNTTENEIISEAESNQNYRIAPFDRNGGRSIEGYDNLPSFDVEFVVKKDDLRADCNSTRKRTLIKPDRILMQRPKNPAITIALREPKKRKRRYLGQFQGYNGRQNQWYSGFKSYVPSPGWIQPNPFESSNLYNAGFQKIPFFTFTAMLPFGFIFELKSQVIELPLDDPRYTLMILMPNHPGGLSELLLLLPTLSLRNIHNSLKPAAVHATVPMFKYTAKVDLTAALQQIGIQDVFYRYRADMSFMSPDARLFVSSVQQVVSVTAKKYSTQSVYEIQRKYVQHNFVVSRPFVYFVLDLHTKVSLIAGVITDPLASPIWTP